VFFFSFRHPSVQKPQLGVGRVASLEQTLHFFGGGSSSLMAINAASAGITQHAAQTRCLLLINGRTNLKRVNQSSAINLQNQI
jgi:hypothetical protein